ncbi:MAG: hypothetical protein GXP47_00035 [Acidobacteria bacterium]|nr:hypothetical protein [Acidobacteriota bacterium]
MNRLTVTVARPGGVPLRIHISWLLLLGWVGWVAAGLPPQVALKLLVLMLLLVGSVLAHELAHALAGRTLGLRATAVTLYPFGGLSTFDRLPAGEARTALVFLAGPAANLAVAAGFWLAGGRSAAVHLAAPAAGAPLVTWLVWSNLSLGLLNLAPILPLDGGQVVRTLLARRMGELRAGRALGMVGQVAGIVALVWGLGGRPWLVLAGLIVLVGATAELQRVHPMILASTQRVRDVMRTAILAVDAATPLAELRETSRRLPGSDFVLLEHGHPCAYLPAARLWRRAGVDGSAPAHSLAEPLGPPLGPDEPLAEAVASMERHGSNASAVVDARGALAGVLPRSGARRSMALLEALSRRSGRSSPEGGGPGDR